MSMTWRDDQGAGVVLDSRPRRVVSLVPSLTEALARTSPELLAGATDWCSQPAGLDVARVRGTKNPDVTAVLALEPDLVLANFEENREADIAALRDAGVPVWVSVIRTVPEALTGLARMLSACGLESPDWLAQARQAWSRPAPAGAGQRRRAFVPVWRKPWMALGRDTFAGDVLARLGVDHVHAADAARYPRVALDDVRGRGVDLVVLPDEPYPFTPDRDLGWFAGWGVTVAFVSGRHLEWYGPSLVEAPRVLRAQLAAGCPSP